MTPPVDPTALTALADWHEKEARHASVESNFDDEADGGPTARFHRQASATIRALASPATPATEGQTCKCGVALDVSHYCSARDHCYTTTRAAPPGWRCMRHGEGCKDATCRDSGRWIDWPPPAALDREALLESREFYEAMQAYRHAPLTDQNVVVAAFEAVKALLRPTSRTPVQASPLSSPAHELSPVDPERARLGIPLTADDAARLIPLLESAINEVDASVDGMTVPDDGLALMDSYDWAKRLLSRLRPAPVSEEP